MKIKVTYPLRKKRKPTRREIINIARWPFLLAAYASPIINLLLQGQPWSLVVLWGLFMVWNLVIYVDMVEYNRMSQFIKLITYSSILLVLIDLCLSPGWAVEVVAIICFGGLAITGILFFTDLNKQRQNMLPMLLLSFCCIIFAIFALIFWKGQVRWPLFVTGALAIALFAACFILLGDDLLREFKKRFHVK